MTAIPDPQCCGALTMSDARKCALLGLTCSTGDGCARRALATAPQDLLDFVELLESQRWGDER